ncbi:2-phosphosulfolactate phosphatase [Acetanaerobacterium sp. MSJ-12]|uniref:2-phosphosulfolactate phosphatase n=1 Tax=Oscillospiraceae TaxID=216572 RepID=UPI00163C2070|nr:MULTISPECIES: 2-phosphosulfolactate phosphatase [Oscillospiraceae]MBC2870687.1 2-phosphosulfolactate phosphatase [Bittarella massiliensis (ex Durand et al. 2017)]MBU5419363.1 2-phosphosulfolactate phosphatase [Acetanaerobacterium sp. MSJ-12]
MQVTVYAQHDFVDPQQLAGSTAVVIDTFRATSTVTAALENGCAAVIPVAHKEDAFRLRREVPAYREALLGGERKTQIIPGFDCGNSPLEYTRARIGGRVLILSTTNGTKAMAKAERASAIYLGCLNNAEAVARRLWRRGEDVQIVCAGTKGNFSLEDVVSAGAMIHYLKLWGGGEVACNDLGYTAWKMFEGYGADMDGLLRPTRHYGTMLKNDLAEDIAYCIQLNISRSVPVCQNGQVVLAPKEEETR